jgi:hypothetical protein
MRVHEWADVAAARAHTHTHAVIRSNMTRNPSGSQNSCYIHTASQKTTTKWLFFPLDVTIFPSLLCSRKEMSICTLKPKSGHLGVWENNFFCIHNNPRPIEPEGSEVCPKSPARQSRLRPARLRTRTRSVEMKKVSDCFTSRLLQHQSGHPGELG